MKLMQNLNCCKSWGCDNFGRPDQADYDQLSHHLGYPALHCQKCGSYPPLINNEAVHQLYLEKHPTHYLHPRLHCPRCFQAHAQNIQRYGVTSSGRQRFRCRTCQKVFTPPRMPELTKLQAILQGIEQQQSPTRQMQRLGLNAKSYYQQLQWLAILLSYFSRHLEHHHLPRTLLAMQSETGILSLAGNIRLWCITTAEAKSGYQLLLNHNASTLSLEDGEYQGKEDNRLSAFTDQSLTEAIKKRYQQIMNRYHFEDIQYGPSACWKQAHLIQPWLISYAHFQILRDVSKLAQHQHHYLEQESCIRGAAIMGAIEAIQERHAEVFYLFSHPDQQTAFWADGRPLGWWKDRWFSTPFGGYCPITERRHYRHPFQMRDIATNQHYFQYLSQHIPKMIKGLAPLNAHLLIQRCCYNFTVDGEQSPAERLGLPHYDHSIQALLNAAYQTDERHYANDFETL
ncbi:hypothetical protein [Celerinatantimonas sp. YJH-8]|uniref:IS1/IS1595 family N-terminal zinc-binding domain-containing protein n=1 Tax=Celerinatantimonas sp. YJH-8 TaxID=3228714 RepID=UPI0038C7D8BA